MGKSYYKVLLGVYFAALAVCGASRVLLKLRFMDLETGFYTHRTGIATVFNAALLIAVVFLLAANRLRRVGGEYPLQKDSRFSGLLAMLTGLAIIAYMLLDQHYPEMEQGYSETLLLARDYVGVGLGILGGLAMIWLGIGRMTGKVSRGAMGPALLTSLWQVYMLITRFNSYTVLTTISDNLLAVLFMIFASLFLIGQARTIFGLSRKDGRNYTIPTGLCASLTGLVLVVPNYLYMALNGVGMPAPMLGLWESVYVLLLSLYALVFVLNMTRSIKQV